MNRLREIQKRASDSKFFSTAKKGEYHELREDLNSSDVVRQKNAIKRVIANMTLGRDVSMLYPDVVKLSKTSNMELKKLVYLYIMNNSRLQPDKAILAVNTFVQDCQHDNPIVRALALRTMLCLRVDSVTDYTTETLKKCISDADPYVRKTAAIGVLKLYAMKPKLVEEHDFINTLKNMIMDHSPMVISNALIALNEISNLAAQQQGKGQTPTGQAATPNSALIDFNLTPNRVNKLMNALPECTEWGQIAILDFIAQHFTNTSQKRDVETMLDRVLPRLSHSNHSIVLSSIGVIVKFIDSVSDEMKLQYYKKLAAPIVTLLNSAPEIQYVVLRNIMIVVQKYPSLLSRDVRAFFCKYNDPIYVKLEKLTVLLKLLSEKNYTVILNEFQEYSSEVDMEFVQKVIKAIGHCALKIEASAERCVEILLECITAKNDFIVNYIVNDCVVAIKDIVRKYPGKFDGAIGVLCEHMDSIDSVEAKEALVWIVGEHASQFDNPVDLLQQFMEDFNDLAPQVQMQVLVSTVKVFLRSPDGNEELLQQVLKLCTELCDNPDLRDRAYIYWRLLSNDDMIDKLTDIIAGSKPSLVTTDYSLPRPLLEELLRHFNSLASTFHRMPNTFGNTKPMAMDDEDDDEDEETTDVVVINSEGDPQPDTRTTKPETTATPPSGSPTTPAQQQQAQQPPPPQQTQPPPPQKEADPLDLLFGDIPPTGTPTTPTPPAATTPTPAPVAPQTQQQPQTQQDTNPWAAPAATTPQPTSPATPNSPPTAVSLPLQPLLPAEKGNGMSIEGAFGRLSDNSIVLNLTVNNNSQSPLQGFQASFNKNAYGLAGPSELAVAIPLLPGKSSNTQVKMHVQQERLNKEVIQIAVKNNTGVYYFQAEFPMDLSFTSAGKMTDKTEFVSQWRGMGDSNEHKFLLTDVRNPNVSAVTTLLASYNIFFIHNRQTNDNENLYFTCTSFNDRIFMEIVLKRDGQHFCCCRLQQPLLVEPFRAWLNKMLSR
eukprot:TRINITY_DN55263_c0_g1_i1.p1 TRINITY_DN55263_c0_g1~~TRINITY_DN55263_c0_g1_i1.p1  ORF type:complete len:994 (+),score=123.10 TRINITY_DN55263_c0_g1_i1:36-3017(+)